MARLAEKLHLAGSVRNTTSAVMIEVEGLPNLLQPFTSRLQQEAPTAATLEHVDAENVPATGDSSFLILESSNEGSHNAGLPPDLAICPGCCREMDDPKDRRYRYSFLNCTACGPRFSIAEALPYDRPRTSMRAFALCEQCRSEYEDHKNRRYHAQPIACPACGPTLWLERNGLHQNGDAIELALNALCAGEVGALRGIGGFHLACDARNSRVVEWPAAFGCTCHDVWEPPWRANCDQQ